MLFYKIICVEEVEIFFFGKFDAVGGLACTEESNKDRFHEIFAPKLQKLSTNLGYVLAMQLASSRELGEVAAMAATVSAMPMR